MKMNLAVFFLFFFVMLCNAEKIVTIEGYSSYTHGDDESRKDAETKCLDYAKRDAIERFATKISSSTSVEDFVLKKDKIIANSAGLLRNIRIIEKDYKYPNVTFKITAEIDEDEALKTINETISSNNSERKISNSLSQKDKAILIATVYALTQIGESYKPIELNSLSVVEKDSIKFNRITSVLDTKIGKINITCLTELVGSVLLKDQIVIQYIDGISFLPITIKVESKSNPDKITLNIDENYSNSYFENILQLSGVKRSKLDFNHFENTITVELSFSTNDTGRLELVNGVGCVSLSNIEE